MLIVHEPEANGSEDATLVGGAVSANGMHEQDCTGKGGWAGKVGTRDVQGAELVHCRRTAVPGRRSCAGAHLASHRGPGAVPSPRFQSYSCAGYRQSGRGRMHASLPRRAAYSPAPAAAVMAAASSESTSVPAAWQHRTGVCPTHTLPTASSPGARRGSSRTGWGRTQRAAAPAAAALPAPPRRAPAWRARRPPRPPGMPCLLAWAAALQTPCWRAPRAAMCRRRRPGQCRPEGRATGAWRCRQCRRRQ